MNQAASRRQTPYPRLFEPITIRGLTLKNRIISTSHAPAYAEQGLPTERYQRYHEEKAKGGLAMTMFGGASSVSIDSPPSFGQLQVGDDRIIPCFVEFSKRIHAHDCALMCQLSHAGRRTHALQANWLPTVAPSPIREPAHGSMPKQLEAAEIRRIVADYAAAAMRCDSGGLDGCEILVSGHLIGQFWSPLSNRRTDIYGGSLENRIRFGLEVLNAIRDVVRVGFIISLRFSADELVEGGLTEAEGLEIARIHAASGLVDCLNVSGAANWTKAGVAETVPSMAFPTGRFIELAGKVRRATGMPVLHASRVNDLATAHFAVVEGHVDLVGMTRAHIADPHLVSKHLSGHDSAIRPCVGAGFCIDRIYRGGDALCVHNAASGRESFLPHVIEPTGGKVRRVVIVGAGPGGLEAARICAERGHEVTVLEAQNQAGGQVPLAAKVSWRNDMIGIARWLYERCEELGVTFRFNCLAQAADVLEYEPDIVILATGGIPDMTGIPGSEALCSSTWDALSGELPVAGDIIVYDEGGDQNAVSAAEYLAANGAKVDFITPNRCAAEAVGVTNHAVHLRNLANLNVTITPDMRLVDVKQSGNRLKATFQHEYGSVSIQRLADSIVIEAGTLPVDELYDELAPSSRNGGQTDWNSFVKGDAQPEFSDWQASGFLLYRIGDATATRGIHAAVFDAARLCSRM